MAQLGGGLSVCLKTHPAILGWVQVVDRAHLPMQETQHLDRPILLAKIDGVTPYVMLEDVPRNVMPQQTRHWTLRDVFEGINNDVEIVPCLSRFPCPEPKQDYRREVIRGLQVSARRGYDGQTSGSSGSFRRTNSSASRSISADTSGV
jgi:hypothetical protein